MLQLVLRTWNKIKPVVNKVLVVAFFVICIAAIYKTCHYSTPVSPGKGLTIEPTKQNIDKNGTTHNVIITKEISQQELDYLTDSIRRSIKGTPQIKEVIKLVPRVDTFWKNLPIVIQGDTIETSKIDSYVTARAIINIKTKVGAIQLSLRDTITQVRTFKKHLFKADERTIDITNKNPYVKIPAGTSFIAMEPKALIVIGPSLVYNPFNNQFQYGVGVTFNVLAIKSRK